jgi:N-acetylglucosamine malate deacetylase 1
MNGVSRRGLLGVAGIAGAAIAAGIPPRDETPPNRKLRIVVAGGHPGDPECGCGGTITRFVDAGHEVTLLYLNRGEGAEPPGSKPGAIRSAEAVKACRILNARPLFAGQIDGRAIVDPDHAEEFRMLLGGERPDAVFTHWPIDNHADHRATSSLVHHAWVRDHRRFAVYFYEVSNGEDTLQFSPDEYVDISTVEPRKRDACRAHASQSPEKFYALQEHVTRMRGIECGVRHAEGFVRLLQGPRIALP